MPMLLIIDPCLYNKNGHEYAMNKCIFEEGKQFGYDPIVLSSTSFFPSPEDTMKVMTIFRCSPYDKKEISLEHDQKVLTLGNREIYEILTQYYPSENLPKGSMILLHTACNSLLVGLARWLKKIHRTDLSIRIVLRWPATRDVFHTEKAEDFCKKACSVYPKLKGDIRFYADNKGLVEYYEKRTGIPFALTPIGIHFQDIPPIPKPNTGPLRFVFVGSPRVEKGIEQICSAIGVHVQTYPNDIFYIHCVGAYHLAQQLQEDFPHNVYTCTESLSGRSYFEFIMQGDVVLIPYDIRAYHLRTSHIFMEALGLGRGVITTKDSWMEEVMTELEIPVGTIMQEWTKEGLLSALHEFHLQRSSLVHNAYHIAPKIRDTHNLTAWMKLMMEPQ